MRSTLLVNFGFGLLAPALACVLGACSDAVPAAVATGEGGGTASAGMPTAMQPVAGSGSGSAGSPTSASGAGGGGGPAAGDGGTTATSDGGSAGAGGGAGGAPLFPANGTPSFKSHGIAQPGGTMFGQTSLVDIDKDGDLDFVAGARDSNVNWYEYVGKDDWKQHTIGGPARTDVGGVAFDVDGDGFIDQVSGSDWYRNTGSPRSAAFTKFATGMPGAHDNVAGDIDSDGKLDVVTLNNSGMWWYGRGADVTQPWTAHQVAGTENPQVHGGVAVGDIDGDGDTDVTRVDKWFENADGKGGSFVTHQAFDFGKNGPFGVQTRAAVVDLDGDGDRDLVQTEGDILNGRVAWFENVDGQGKSFNRHVIRDSGHQQDFHSLAVADFDRDGDIDVFSCGGPLTSGERKWLLWQNVDGKGQTFKETQLFAGPECHEAVAADVDGDGDIDVCSKPWDGGDNHVYLENLLIP